MRSLWILQAGAIRRLLIVILLNDLVQSFSFLSRRNKPTCASLNIPLLQASSKTNKEDESTIEFQAQCGRGEDHLSAFLEEGDVVVYQTGTWFVDGVEVGDGSEPKFHYCQMETLQLVWTHNCEHGVIRGYQLDCLDSETLELSDEVVEFGPEQLIARIPVSWVQQGDGGQRAISPISLRDDLWRQ